MAKKLNIGGFLLILATTVLVLMIGFTRVNPQKAKLAYMVYLDGKKIGLIENKDALFNLIDNEQENIKKEFTVEKVYPPEGLEAVEYTTFENRLKSAEEIYNLVASKSTFTIKGYTITIKGEEKDPIYINILNKEDLEPALLDAVSAFIPIAGLEAYIKDKQVEIVDTGKKIESVYFEEKITVKESYIPVDEKIITNKSDLTKYLLFGTLEPQDEYTVKEGDTLEKIAENNELSSEELLIANPSFSSINSLISPGQKLKIGLINPLFTIVEEAEIVEDVSAAFDTVTEYDQSLYPSETYVKQKGVNGVNRLTEKVLSKNGEIKTLYVSDRQEISLPINKIVVRGTKISSGFNQYPPAVSSTDWGWPTISPYVITSKYGYRWGRHHGAIDISGSGFGSPIYSATSGTVTKVFKGCADRGYYGSSCGGELGNYVEIETDTGLTIFYAHMRNIMRVSVGQTVSKGQIIGYMGSSGSSTGTHLHFEIRDSAGNKLNPCKVAFVC